MKKLFVSAAASCALFAGAASAATISGTWEVTAVNVIGTNSADSAATVENYDNALAAAGGGAPIFLTASASEEEGPQYSYDQFTYSGKLDFGTFDTENDATTILDWLNTGKMGSISGLDEEFGGQQMSAPNINNGTATTTFFYFFDAGESALQGPMYEVAQFASDELMPETCPGGEGGTYSAGDLTITHDDGVYVCDAGGFAGPNGVRDTEIAFGGGYFDFIYVATNGDPSVLKVDLQPVPLPAGMPLLLAGLGGLAFMRRRSN